MSMIDGTNIMAWLRSFDQEREIGSITLGELDELYNPPKPPDIHKTETVEVTGECYPDDFQERKRWSKEEDEAIYAGRGSLKKSYTTLADELDRSPAACAQRYAYLNKNRGKDE